MVPTRLEGMENAQARQTAMEAASEVPTRLEGMENSY